MRTITEYSTHIYTTKASATRAARNLIGESFAVHTPELENRFFGLILVTADMVSVKPHGEGWRWLYAFDLADVVVEVLHKSFGDGKVPEQVRYAEVANWQDARTPPIEEVVPPQTLGRLERRVSAYMRKVDGPSDNRFFTECCELRALCRQVGTTLEAMLRRLGFFDVAPTTPAPTSPPTVPTTLPELAERVEQYRDSIGTMLDARCVDDAAAYREREEPSLLEACRVLGVDYSHVLIALDNVRLALESTNPGWMAEVALDVASFGLDTRIRGRLAEQARRRGVPVWKYLQLAAEKLQRRAA